jgi:hypothetical protein
MANKVSMWRALLNTLGNAAMGRVHFPKGRVGETITMDDGRRFEIFRQAIVDAKDVKNTAPGARFIVRFRLANMSMEINKPFSLIPMPFCIGVPGFRNKLWTLDRESGDFQGIYEFDTVEDADNYAHSFAVTFMTGRSMPGSVSYKILPLKEKSFRGE